MIKNLTLLILSLMFFNVAKAQRDTVVLYMKNSGVSVKDKDSADYFRLVFPPDTVGKFAVYKVHDFYLNRNPKSLHTEIKPLGKFGYMVKQGICNDYYPNRKLKKVTEYDYGNEVGIVMRYYTDEKVYCVMKRNAVVSRLKYVECRDSTGKVIAKNGKGYWIKLNDDLKLEAEGPIEDSLEHGNWRGIIDDTSKYECIYVKGAPTSGIGYDKSGNAHPFTQIRVEPVFKHGYKDFSDYLSNDLNYPDIDRSNNVQGRVIVTFVIERDGRVSNVKVLHAPDQSLASEAERIVSLSPRWKPAIQYGMLVRTQYTLPVVFGITNQPAKN